MSDNKKQQRHRPSLPERIEMRMDEVAQIVERTRPALGEQDHAKLKTAMDTLTFITAELQAKRTSLERLVPMRRNPTGRRRRSAPSRS
jgi:hypothetical protein